MAASKKAASVGSNRRVMIGGGNRVNLSAIHIPDVPKGMTFVAYARSLQAAERAIVDTSADRIEV